jgi:hypothetical protein
VLLTSRDLEIIDLIYQFGVIDADQIYRLFFAQHNQGKLIARRRLREILAQNSEIKRIKDPLSGRYIYYLKKAQLRHKVLIAEFYTRLKTGRGEIKKFVNPYHVNCSFGDLYPDAYAIYQLGDQVYFWFLEVQISTNPLNLSKYERLYRSGEWRFPVFPRVLVVGDRKFNNNTGLEVEFVGTKFEGFELT